MAFKIKDLMINDLRAGQREGVFEHTLCTGGTGKTGIFIEGCGAITTRGCAQSLVWCDVTWPEVLRLTVPDTSAATLATLKGQLKQQLAEVEKHEAAAEESLLPKTVEEVDALTGRLSEALQELKVRRTELSKKPVAKGDK